MILASQSPRRRELLSEAGFDLDIRPADIDEARLPGESPMELVARLAAEKAEAARATLDASPSDGLLVAADTIVWMGDEALGKPEGPEDAARMLRELSGRTHHVSTGVCVLSLAEDGSAEERASFVETTDVTFWELTDAEIAAYVSTGEPLDKAGAYGIQGAGRLLVERIDGDYSNVVGLPVARLVREVTRLMGDEKDYVAEAIRMGGPLA
ncbi:Maf family protein [Thermophilibacter sp. ET337]|uniref:Maf family protein n=1 Tax=Thermophilibacter sp. ET337 TaxID=2973084 RepID=UPI0021ACE0F3|nr:Maf family protein [Thermophilibacter sp. ET337]MCR8908620.1 Maf family protein [Thermophilibacter sp. ET337]